MSNRLNQKWMFSWYNGMNRTDKLYYSIIAPPRPAPRPFVSMTNDDMFVWCSLSVSQSGWTVHLGSLELLELLMWQRGYAKFRATSKVKFLKTQQNWWLAVNGCCQPPYFKRAVILTVYLSHFFSGSYGSQRLAGKMCLFFSYQLLSTTLPAWDFNKEKTTGFTLMWL